MTTYLDDSFTSTTFLTEPLGYPIYADDTLRYADTEEYYADGSPRFREDSHTTTTYAKEVYS